jgi:tetratricopeptide (TPR) repeat protein
MNNAKQDINNLISKANKSLVNEDFEKASILFSELNQLLPSNFHIKCNLAVCLGKQNKYEESLNLYLEAKEISKDNPDIYYNLGNAFANLKKTQESIYNYKKCLELEPTYMDAWSNLADVYLLNRDYSLCNKISEVIFSYNSSYPKAFMYKGVSLVGLHKYKESLEYLKKSLDINNDCHNSKRALATALHYLGNKNNAVKLIKETDGVFNFFSDNRPYEII